MSGVTRQLGELDGGEELHEGLFIGVGRRWRGRSRGGGRPASLAGGFNGARPLASVAERRGAAARSARRHRVTGPLGQARQCKWRGWAARRGARLEQCGLGRRGSGAVLSTGGAASIRVAIDGARHRERRGGTGRQDRSGRAERRAGRPGRVVRMGLRDACAARGCVGWPADADASASLACVLCSSAACTRASCMPCVC